MAKYIKPVSKLLHSKKKGSTQLHMCEYQSQKQKITSSEGKCLFSMRVPSLRFIGSLSLGGGKCDGQKYCRCV